MTELYRFTSGGAKALVTREFLTEDITYEDSRLDEFRTGTPYEANLDALGQVLDWVMDEDSPFEPGDSDLDAAVAPALRRCVDVPRRAAGDSRIWNYLAVGWRPDYVRYRWPPDTGNRSVQSMRDKFTKSMKDLYAPAFGRLWFMAEFTRNDGDYGPTESILTHQYATNRLFDRTDLRQSAVLRGIARVVEDVPDDEFINDDEIFERTAQAISHDISSISVESIPPEGMAKIVKKHYHRVRDSE
jgi:hypothetical protein